MSAAGFWSLRPGIDWEHGLPAGNGAIGAVLSGTAAVHEITLAHERVVLPTDPPRRAPDLASDVPEIRHLIESGRAQESADLAVKRAMAQGYPGLQWTDPLVPCATLCIRAPGSQSREYRREVDMECDVVSTFWKQGDDEAAIEMFVSRSDHVLIVRVSGAARRGSVSLKAPANVVTSTSGVKGGNSDRAEFAVGVDEQMQWVRMRFRAEWPLGILGADCAMHVLHEDAEERLIAVALAPASAVSPGTHERAVDTLRALPGDYDTLLARHVAAFRQSVHVARLSLDAPRDDRPVEDLLQDSSPDSGRKLIELQYRNAQRLIAGSTGTLPPTLQGAWSGTFDPAWSSDYTLNGNVQCGSIASMLGTGNPRQMRVYLDMLEGFTSDFRDNAARLFGVDGFVLPSRCSPTHAACTHFDADHCHEFWTAGGGWSALFFLDYVWHTGDLEYLRHSAYPFAREVERFYEGFLSRDSTDQIVFNPSYSPENRSPTYGSQACRNATMDRAVLDRLLAGLLRASALLGVDADLTERREEWLRALPPYRVAPDGTLAEWLDDAVVERIGHRTASHLLGTWNEPDGRFFAELREPTRELIRIKLAWRASGEGREEMAYGLVQLGVAASVVGDAGLALECVERMSRLYFLPSLSTTHDVGAIFNVDISGGFPAVINSMLVGSEVGRIRLIPALPWQWPNGALDGIHIRGGIVIDKLWWTPTRVQMTAHTLTGARALRAGGSVRVSVPDGWVIDPPDAPPGAGQCDIDPDDGASFSLSARR